MITADYAVSVVRKQIKNLISSQGVMPKPLIEAFNQIVRELKK